MPDQKIPLSKALFFLFVTTLIVSGSGYFGIQSVLRKKKPASRMPLTTIIQTGPAREALKTTYLAELLDLSSDHPTACSAFDRKRAREKLLRSPVIKTADVKIYPPQTVYVAYTVRQPLACLTDVENGVLDSEGILFPLSPFFAPKTLPQIYLGLTTKVHWNQSFDSPSLRTAFDLLKILSGAPYRDLFRLECIDVSKALTKSYGTREIVLSIQEPFGPIFLRLTPRNSLKELGNYLELRKELAAKPPSGKPLVVDLRIPNLAFMQ